MMAMHLRWLSTADDVQGAMEFSCGGGGGSAQRRLRRERRDDAEGMTCLQGRYTPPLEGSRLSGRGRDGWR